VEFIQKKTILVIEDEPPMLKILTDALAEQAFETIQARNGEQGLLIALQKHPDLILVDILMPEMDGLTMMKKLREDSWGQTVPVVVLTNVNPDTNSTLQAIVANQPAYYFVKSDMQLENIVEKIKELLKPPASTN
jgi:DNA-binding response OmpR family regulator